MVQKRLLSDSPEHLIRRYIRLLQKSGIPVENVIMFGSFATGKPHSWSDLDLCVVSRTFGERPLHESMELAALATRVDSLIEPHPYHPDALLNRYDPLATEIRAHGILFPIH